MIAYLTVNCLRSFQVLRICSVETQRTWLIWECLSRAPPLLHPYLILPLVVSGEAQWLRDRAFLALAQGPVPHCRATQEGHDRQEAFPRVTQKWLTQR